MSSKLCLDEALRTYEEVHLASRNFAPRTRREYLTDLRQLCEYLGRLGVKRVDRVALLHLEGFLAELDRQHLTGSTRRRKLAALRSLFQFLEEAGFRRDNPA